MPATLLAVTVPAVAANAAARPAARPMSPSSPSSGDETMNKPGSFKPTTYVPSRTVKKTVRRAAPSRYRQLPARVMRLNWHALAMCESGGRPGAVSRNGLYRGMYQFSVGTWHGVGGRGLPNKASKVEQTYRAQLLYMRSGARPWPICGKKLFRY